MTAYSWSSLIDKQSVAFDPLKDLLLIDDLSISAAFLIVRWTDATSVTLSYGGKTISILTDIRSLTTSNLQFQDGSLLIVGDNAVGVANDDGANNFGGSPGSDQFIGLGGNDQMSGGLGSNVLNGGDGDDKLYGGPSNDTLIGGAGSDIMMGGDGDDVYNISSRDFYIYDSSGRDTAIVSANFVKIPKSIETVFYINGAQALPYWIDALIFDDAASYRSLLGPSKTFKYTYPTAIPSYDTSAGDANGYTPFTEAQKAFSLEAMNYISSVADLQFVPTRIADAPNTITFANNTQTTSSGYAQRPGPGSANSDIFFNSLGLSMVLADGTAPALTLIHELGHALGLKHPFSHPQAGDGSVDPGPYLPAAEENTAWTVMSYEQNPAQYHLQFSPLDIAALQYLYGPSQSARTGYDTYLIDVNTSNFIWDGAGVDTLSAEGISAAVTLYLEPGYWGFVGAKSNFITAAGQVTVNFGTVIENVIGGSGDDHLYGNGVNNEIKGLAGNDTIDGGDGTGDLSTYRGVRSDYVITKIADHVYTVRDTVSGRDGTDTVSNVEFMKFSDNIFDIAALGPNRSNADNDLNADGHSDILLQNTNGACYVWQLGGGANGLGITANGFIGGDDGPGAKWQVKATGDFDGDGKSDLLLQYKDTGAVYVWEMNGKTIKVGGFVGGDDGPGAKWQVKATGDFDGDGHSDILLQYADTGACFVWETGANGLTVKKYGFIGGEDGPGAKWQVKGAGDFDGDGHSDILLQNADTGACFVWQMGPDGLTVKKYGFIGGENGPGAKWQVKGVGDIDGDGKSDILLQYADTGACFVWQMGADGLSVKNYGFIGPEEGSGAKWQVKGMGDFDGDGKSDILLQYADTGACYVWELDGLTIKAGGFVGGYDGPGADWHASA